MSKFTALGARLSGAVDAGFGDKLHFMPQGKKDNFGNIVAADDRVEADVIGTLIRGTAQITFTDGDRRKTDFNSRASRQDVHATFDRAQFINGLPRQGDFILTTYPDPIVTYEVVDVYDSGSRIICPLVRK